MDKYNLDGHKLHHHLERVLQWKQAKTFEQKMAIAPIYVEISPSNLCNHNCTFCALDFARKEPLHLLDVDAMCNTISSMSRLGVKSIMFGGEGEPCLNMSLAIAINWAKKEGIDIGLTTNGTALTQRFLEACMPSLSWIKISINGGDRETYGKIHQAPPEDFNKVWNNIAVACCTKAAMGLDCILGIQSILLPENVHTIESTVVDAVNCGVDYVVVKPYSHHPRSLTQIYKGITYGDARRMARELAQHNTDDFQVVTRYLSMSNLDNPRCRSYFTCQATPYFWAYVMANGDVYACSSHLYDERFCLGNILQSSFEAIWQGEKRKELIDAEWDLSECRINCRMHAINEWLWDIRHPNKHKNFI